MDEDGRGLQDRATGTRLLIHNLTREVSFVNSIDRFTYIENSKSPNTPLVLCDLNLDNRGCTVGNMVLACRIAKQNGARVVGWCSLSSIIGRIRLPLETQDLILVASNFDVEASYCQPRFSPRLLTLANVVLLVRLMSLSIFSSRRLSRVIVGGVPIGRQAVDSQRRRTLRLNATTVVWLKRDELGLDYPWVPVSRSGFINLFALCLPRFAARAWLNYIFWLHFLDSKCVVMSVQSHTERAEFGPLTRLLYSQRVPILVHLERLELFDDMWTNRTAKGRLWLSQLQRRERIAYLDWVRSNLEKSFVSQPDVGRLYSSTFIGSPREQSKAIKAVQDFLHEHNQKVIALLLPATFEAFGHDSGVQIFSNFDDWFYRVFGVAARASAAVLIKPHPHSDSEEIARIAGFLRSRRYVRVAPHLLITQQVGVSVIAHFRDRSVATMLASSSIPELGFLGMPLVVAGSTPYSAWSYASQPRTAVDYERKLEEVLAFGCSYSIDEVLESVLLTNHHSSWRPPLEPLSTQSAFEDLNQDIHSTTTRYAKSSLGRSMTRESLWSAYRDAAAWEFLASDYNPPPHLIETK
jgi:hypothetical protein